MESEASRHGTGDRGWARAIGKGESTKRVAAISAEA
jgi:hypothetical protein